MTICPINGNAVWMRNGKPYVRRAQTTLTHSFLGMFREQYSHDAESKFSMPQDTGNSCGGLLK